MRLGIEKSARHGVAVVALRNSGHLGRIGDWPLMAAEAGRCVPALRQHLGGRHPGGAARRHQPPPLRQPNRRRRSRRRRAAAAAGHLRLHHRRGENQGGPEQGRAGAGATASSTPRAGRRPIPRVFYADPPGAILSIAGHKGYGLAVICEVLAGALTGGGCSNPANAGRVVNGMLSILLDPSRFQDDATFSAEINRFIAWVKSSARVSAGRRHPDARRDRGAHEGAAAARRHRTDDTTWGQIRETARGVGLGPERVEAILHGGETTR